jgi:gamma-glutamyltranspeptidase/glutathione hydrolase
VVNPELVPMRERIQATAESKRLFTRSGTLLGAGEILAQPDLAGVLEEIGREGPDAFYTGAIGERIAADLAANGSTITSADLAAYRAEITTPLRGTYLGKELVTVPPPGGGVCVLQMLNFLEAIDADRSDWPSARGVAELAEAMAWAFSERDRSLADPKFWPVPVDRMISKTEARAAAARFAAGEMIPVFSSPQEPSTTTQVCVIDATGNAVSLTHTLGSSSGVVSPDWGSRSTTISTPSTRCPNDQTLWLRQRRASR